MGGVTWANWFSNPPAAAAAEDDDVEEEEEEEEEQQDDDDDESGGDGSKCEAGGQWFMASSLKSCVKGEREGESVKIQVVGRDLSLGREWIFEMNDAKRLRSI